MSSAALCEGFRLAAQNLPSSLGDPNILVLEAKSELSAFFPPNMWSGGHFLIPPPPVTFCNCLCSLKRAAAQFCPMYSLINIWSGSHCLARWASWRSQLRGGRLNGSKRANGGQISLKYVRFSPIGLSGKEARQPACCQNDKTGIRLKGMGKRERKRIIIGWWR